MSNMKLGVYTIYSKDPKNGLSPYIGPAILNEVLYV